MNGLNKIVLLVISVIFVFIFSNCTKDDGQIYIKGENVTNTPNYKTCDDDEFLIIIRGKVQSSTGLPIINAIVKIKVPEQTFYFDSITSDNSGEYYFDNLDNIAYELKITAQGYHDLDVQNVIPSNDNNRIDTM